MDKIYGIDLGTTNSMICYEGKTVTELVPSIASIPNKQAGEKLRMDYDTSRSFKINMSLGREGKESIVASALVLREMKRLAKKAGHDVTKVVISVPAYFSDNQRQATIKAASLAKLEVVSLLNEPTAAAIFYSKNYKGLSVVYDLGGGTFDVSVIDSRFNNYDVQATSGLVVGGDNLDLAIVRHIAKLSNIKTFRLTTTETKELKVICESAKIVIQKTKKSVKIDTTSCGGTEVMLTVNDYVKLVRDTFGETLVKVKSVIAESIQYGEPYNIITVGGSSRCPYLNDMLKEATGITPVALTYNPDKIVAQGASLYGEMLTNGEADFLVSDITKAIGIGMYDGTVKRIIENNSKIPCRSELIVTNPTDSTGLILSLYQGDSALIQNNELIGTMEYDYGEFKKAGFGRVVVAVSVGRDGTIELEGHAPLKPTRKIQIKRASN